MAVVFQDMVVEKHLYSDGSPIEAGEIDSHNMMLDLTYGVTDKVALNVSVPYVSARYTGPNAHPGSVLDDGAYHGTMQDFRINVRYGLNTGGTAIAPFADLIVPSHDYEYYGHAAPDAGSLNYNSVSTSGMLLPVACPACSCRDATRTDLPSAVSGSTTIAATLTANSDISSIRVSEYLLWRRHSTRTRTRAPRTTSLPPRQTWHGRSSPRSGAA